ncbi:MAG: glycolate oxidase subunit GlcF [Rhodocyclaceae bacterium]|nr:glycolate oxidase subunit GlcF [Rhodocyclaceae bacterium]
MQTNLADFIKDTAQGQEAESILRACVHCGFCTATCPTYQLLGDELDGPRGRIYLIKQVLEGREFTASTQLHLDRCLTCRSCESTCPSGVQYGRLVDIGREVVEKRVARPAGQRAVRWLLKEFVPRASLFGASMALGRAVKPLLPQVLKAKVPDVRAPGRWPERRHPRRWIALAGCAQPAMAPSVNRAAARVLDAVGISLIEVAGAGCCGAVRYHLNDQPGGLDDARRNVDAWAPLLERGEVEGILMTASGCGVQVREYGHLLAGDARYRDRARQISESTLDLSELLTREVASLERVLQVRGGGSGERISFHAPCTLQHGQKIRGVVERLLLAAGYELTVVADAHLCCGSAGTYSLLQPELSMRLRDNKLAALGAGGPNRIASANVGCMTHLESAATVPVVHWIELIDERLHAAKNG